MCKPKSIMIKSAAPRSMGQWNARIHHDHSWIAAANGKRALKNSSECRFVPRKLYFCRRNEKSIASYKTPICCKFKSHFIARCKHFDVWMTLFSEVVCYSICCNNIPDLTLFILLCAESLSMIIKNATLLIITLAALESKTTSLM